MLELDEHSQDELNAVVEAEHLFSVLVEPPAGAAVPLDEVDAALDLDLVLVIIVTGRGHWEE